MKKTLLTLALIAAPAAAFAETLDDLREQGFARIAIANEPPFTAVAADGTGEPVRRTSDLRNNRSLEMSHDTSKVAYLSGRDEVRVMDLADFTVGTAAKREVWFRGALPRWSPDDRYLMFTGFIAKSIPLSFNGLRKNN